MKTTKRRLRAPFPFEVPFLFLEKRDAYRWTMPLRPRDLRGRYRSGPRLGLPLHGLPVADRIALSGHADLFRRANQDHGRLAENLQQDRRQRSPASSALLRGMRLAALHQWRGRSGRLGNPLGRHPAARPDQAGAPDLVPFGGALDQRSGGIARTARRLRRGATLHLTAGGG